MTDTELDQSGTFAEETGPLLDQSLLARISRLDIAARKILQGRQKGEKRKDWKERIKNTAEDEEAFKEKERQRAREQNDVGVPDGGVRSWPVVLNELMARNLTATVDDQGEFDDWVELHNRSSVDVDMEGCALTDDPANPARYLLFARGSVIPARSYLVVFADEQPRQGPLHAPFKLGADGDMLVLMDPDGNALDQVGFGPQPADLSLGRMPDAQGPFMELTTPTPGAPNVTGPARDAGVTLDAGRASDAGPRPAAQGVVINELMSDNATTLLDEFAQPADWVELLNRSTSPADLSGHHLSDDPARPDLWTFPSGTVMAPGSYLLVWADGQGHQGSLHAGFKLTPRGEQVLLTAPDGTLLDAHTFPAQGIDVSDGRLPDGTGALVRQVRPTPGARNLEAPDAGRPLSDGGAADAGRRGPQGVVFNEWLASNAHGFTDERGEHEDWIELYNTQAQSVDLAGSCLSDEPHIPQKWCFPEGSQLGPHGFLLVVADNERDGPLHAAFKLSAQGETLTLVAPDGTLVDSRTFGTQQEDRSEGRSPDGHGPAVPLAQPTPGAPNVQ